jgi:hypothetical protein
MAVVGGTPDSAPIVAGAGVAVILPLLPDLMCVALMVLAGLAAVVVGALNLAAGETGAGVAVLIPSLPHLVCVAVLIAGDAAGVAGAVNSSIRSTGATVAVFLPLVASLMRVAIVILTALAAVLLGALNLSSCLAGAGVAVIGPPVAEFVRVASVVLAGGAAILCSTFNLSSKKYSKKSPRLAGASGAVIAPVAICSQVQVFPPLVTNLTRVTPVVFTGLAAEVPGAVNLSSNGARATVAFFLPLAADLMHATGVIPTDAVIAPLAPDLVSVAKIVSAGLPPAEVVGAVRLAAGETCAGVAVLLPLIPNLMFI